MVLYIYWSHSRSQNYNLLIYMLIWYTRRSQGVALPEPLVFFHDSSDCPVLHVHEEVASGLVVVTWGIPSGNDDPHNGPNVSENTSSQALQPHDPAVLQEQCETSGSKELIFTRHLLDSHRCSSGQVADGKDLGHDRRTLVRLGNIGILMLHHSWPQFSRSKEYRC